MDPEMVIQFIKEYCNRMERHYDNLAVMEAQKERSKHDMGVYEQCVGMSIAYHDVIRRISSVHDSYDAFIDYLFDKEREV